MALTRVCCSLQVGVSLWSPRSHLPSKKQANISKKKKKKKKRSAKYFDQYSANVPFEASFFFPFSFKQTPSTCLGPYESDSQTTAVTESRSAKAASRHNPREKHTDRDAELRV
jgi:hypothetical protein